MADAAARRADIYVQRVQAFLARYANRRRGHGGYPTAEERFAVDMVLKQYASARSRVAELEGAAGPLLKEIELYPPSSGEDDDEVVEVKLGHLKTLRRALLSTPEQREGDSSNG